MSYSPTHHLRFVERKIRLNHPDDENLSVTQKVKILQQFIEHEGGKEVFGNMFVQIYGTWKDVRTEEE